MPGRPVWHPVSSLTYLLEPTDARGASCWSGSTQADCCTGVLPASAPLHICLSQVYPCEGLLAPKVPFPDVVTGGPVPPHLATVSPWLGTWYLAAALSIRKVALPRCPPCRGGTGSIVPGPSRGRGCCCQFSIEASLVTVSRCCITTVL